MSSAPGSGTPESLIRISKSRSSAESFTWVIKNCHDQDYVTEASVYQNGHFHSYRTRGEGEGDGGDHLQIKRIILVVQNYHDQDYPIYGVDDYWLVTYGIATDY